MTPTVKLILILFGLAYLISPVDIIPDLLLPWVGWIDDGLVLWCVYYLIRYGELPWFLFKRPGKPRPGKGKPAGPARRGTGRKRRDSGTVPPKTARPNHQGKEDKTRTKKASQSRNAGRDFQANSGKASPYQILGVNPDASWDEIHSAYKEKIKQYHPDKLSHLGEEFSSLANEKFLEIQAAYNHLKSLHQRS